MDHNSQIRNVYTAAGMQEKRKLEADTNGTTAEEAEGSTYPEKTADEKKEQEKQAYKDYMKKITPQKNLALQMLKSFLKGGLKLLSVTWHGEGYRGKLVFPSVDPAQCTADGI